MKTATTHAWAFSTGLLLSSATLLTAEENAKLDSPKKVEVKAATPSPKKEAKSEKPKKQTAESKLEAKKKALSLENAVTEEKLKQKYADLHAQITRLQLEKTILTESLAIAELKQKQAMAKEAAQHKKETAQLARDTATAKLTAEKLAAELKTVQSKSGIELTILENEIKSIEANQKRENFADSKPIYLADPLQKNDSLVISDRRIDLNGPIFSGTADHVSERINYFNNKNSEHPIFIVIDSSPGGSVMSGMSILKAMHGSDAPVYVVVKTFAASMAAALTTLAERSFAFPNAIILHHQVMSGTFGNLTEAREHTEQLEEWWRRLADPIAEKMGISREEFINKMYEETVSGDWAEFADQAQELKWVDHVVENIKETALLTNPDAKTPPKGPRANAINEPNPENSIPRMNPKDMLYLYNPDGYYQNSSKR